MNREEYERDLKERQRKHLESLNGGDQLATLPARSMPTLPRHGTKRTRFMRSRDRLPVPKMFFQMLKP